MEEIPGLGRIYSLSARPLGSSPGSQQAGLRPEYLLRAHTHCSCCQVEAAAWDVSAAVARNHRLRPHQASRFGLRAGAQSWASHSSWMGHLGLAHSRPSANCSCGLPWPRAEINSSLLLFLPHSPAPHWPQQTLHQVLPPL